MAKLRRLLCNFYGITALVWAMFAFSTIGAFSRGHRVNSFVASVSEASGEGPISHAFTLVLLCLVFTLPVAGAFVFGMAWWTIRHGKPSLRGWAIASSILFLSMGGLLLVASLRFPNGPILIGTFITAVGIAGFVAFIKKDPALSKGTAPPKRQRIAGDGTSRVLDVVSFIVTVGGILGGTSFYENWGRAHHLPSTYGLSWWLIFLLAMFVSTALHESGHATAALALGMKLRMFIVGPLQWRVRDGRWRFEFNRTKLFGAGGATGAVPSNPHQSRDFDICMISAGPLASLLTGLLSAWITASIPGSPFNRVWEFFAILATLGLVSFGVNLIPLQGEAFYSDGAQIYQLLRGGPWADLHRVKSLVASTLVTPLRPRDFDIEAIRRAEASFQVGRQAMVLRLFATSYFVDSQNFDEARDSFSETERISRDSALDLPPELLSSFVFDAAFLMRDAGSAQKWWNLMEAKKPSHIGVDHWLARCAMLWGEGNLTDARNAWESANTIAQKLPSAGAYEFDRFRAQLLKQQLDGAMSMVKPGMAAEVGVS